MSEKRACRSGVHDSSERDRRRRVHYRVMLGTDCDDCGELDSASFLGGDGALAAAEVFERFAHHRAVGVVARDNVTTKTQGPLVGYALAMRPTARNPRVSFNRIVVARDRRLLGIGRELFRLARLGSPAPAEFLIPEYETGLAMFLKAIGGTAELTAGAFHDADGYQFTFPCQ